MNISNLRVKTKLMLAFVVMAALVLLVSGLSLHSLTSSNDRFSGYLSGVGTRERLASDIQAAASARAIAARNLVLVTLPQDRELEKNAVAVAQAAVDSSIAALKSAIAKDPATTPRDRELMGELEVIEGKYGPVAAAIGALALADKRDEAVTKMNIECRPLLAALLKSTKAFIEHDQAQAAAQVKQAEAQFTADRLLLVCTCALASLAAGLLGWALSNGITKPLSRAVTLAEAVASGDLRSDIVVDRKDEMGQLLGALKRMNDSLSDMVGNVRQSADGISIASQEIASGNQDLSGRSETQASALQQTASSMQHMTDTVQQNAENSRQASTLAGSAAEVASHGGAVVQQMVLTMSEISASSKKIGDIIGVIDSIAFQTNILALNAAVEAARAGEQGRGFAVVASEVRGLAQRSADAAKEIKALISASVEKVESGSTLAGVAGTTISDLVTRVRQMTDLIGEISASTSAQSTGIGQVNQAVASIDQGTQQNAALVEQSAAAAESLMQQASGLLSVISRFKVGTMERSFA